MSENIPPALIHRFQCLLQKGSFDSKEMEWLEKTLNDHPSLARTELSNGTLPLRVVLEHRLRPYTFELFLAHGAEHDIITASASVDSIAVEQLLRNDPQLVHATDKDGNTPLHWACAGNKYAKQPCDSDRLVDLIIAAGANVNIENSYGETPLDRDLLYGDGDALEVLLEHGAVPTILFGLAAEDYELLDSLLNEKPEQIDWRCPPDGESLLHIAIRWECSFEMLDYLLAQGSRDLIESRSGKSGWTPLLLAIKVEDYEATEYLIRLGADVNAQEQRKSSSLADKSVLEIAVDCDRVGMAELLIRKGADPQKLGYYGGSLLCYVKSSEMAELLISAGVDLYAPTQWGKSPLDKAVEEGRRDVVSVLVRHGAHPTFFAYVVLGDRQQLVSLLDKDLEIISSFNCPEFSQLVCNGEEEDDDDDDGFEIPLGSMEGTALHYAVKAGLLEIVKLLIDRGADVNAATTAKWTPMHDATYYTILYDLREGNDIIRLLIAAGADKNAKTMGGYRPVDIAQYMSFRDRSCDVFELLVAEP